MTKKQLPIVSKDGNEEEAQKTAERLITIYKENKMDLPIANGKALNVEKLEQWIDKKTVQKDMVENSLGFGLLLMKKYLGHGMFNAWLEKKGLGKRTAQDAMKVTEMLCQLSDANAQRVARLPKGKQNALTTAPFLLLDDLLDNDEITEEMSREQMREIIRLEKKVLGLSEKLDKSEEEKRAALLAAANKRQQEQFPDYVATTREESTALSNEIEVRLVAIERLFHNLLDQVTYTRNDEEAQRFLQIAETSLYHNLNGVVARAIPILTAMREQYAEDVTGPVVDMHVIFTKEEAVAAVSNREMLQQRQMGEEEIRQIERDVKKRSKRGRKSKGAR